VFLFLGLCARVSRHHSLLALGQPSAASLKHCVCMRPCQVISCDQPLLVPWAGPQATHVYSVPQTHGGNTSVQMLLPCVHFSCQQQGSAAAALWFRAATAAGFPPCTACVLAPANQHQPAGWCVMQSYVFVVSVGFRSFARQ
jgi:hypothetical protein